MLRFLRIVLTAATMIAVVLMAAAITLRIALHGHEVTIPDLSGMTVSEASQAALDTGVDLNVENKFYSTTVPVGRILSQAPAPGSRVRHGWQVRVTESLGPQHVTIPNVVGESVQQASMNVRKLQLELGTVAHIDAQGDPDMVLAQTPPPRAGLDQPRINLLVSTSASASKAFVMPSLVGGTFAEATRTAAALGLKVDVAAPSAASTSALPGAIVVEQIPASGYKASAGDILKLTLAH
jgi:beta-lactam-binding protein with PASTA domain